MKWLRDNFVGMALLGMMAALLLISFSLVVAWMWPVSSDTSVQTAEDLDAAATVVAASDIGPVSDYQVINERPVFSLTRQPTPVESEEVGEVVEQAPVVRDAPEARLTGVFISPGIRIASLMPLQGEQVSVTAKQGESLIGDWVGWAVSEVQPRHVVLTSRDGETLKLDLKVHDVKIEEPPKMELPVAADIAADSQDDAPIEEGGETLSRAEQIRSRIAERREELRRQQQEAQSGGREDNDGGAKKAAPPPDYQSAIRALMNNRAKDKNSNDEKDS